MRPQDLFGSYLLLDKIRSDELSTSWRVGELEDRRIVRLALLQIFDGERCDREAIAGALDAGSRAEQRLAGPGYAKLIDSGQVDGVPFLAYDYLSAFTIMEVLARMADRSRGAGIDIALLIAERLALSLGAAWNNAAEADRLPHGCLASSQALVSHEGEVIVIGFSAAAGLRASLSRPSSDLSSSIDRYISPAALARTEIQPTDDVYSLGAILYELITCEPVGHSADRPLEDRIDAIGLNAETSDLAEAVRSLLRSSLGVEANRFPNVSAWRNEVSRIVDDSGHHPTTFNVAFLLHSLFSSEITLEDRAIERDARLFGTYATSLDLRQAPTGRPADDRTDSSAAPSLAAAEAAPVPAGERADGATDAAAGLAPEELRPEEPRTEPQIEEAQAAECRTEESRSRETQPEAAVEGPAAAFEVPRGGTPPTQTDDDPPSIEGEVHAESRIVELPALPAEHSANVQPPTEMPVAALAVEPMTEQPTASEPEVVELTTVDAGPAAAPAGDVEPTELTTPDDASVEAQADDPGFTPVTHEIDPSGRRLSASELLAAIGDRPSTSTGQNEPVEGAERPVTGVAPRRVGPASAPDAVEADDTATRIVDLRSMATKVDDPTVPSSGTPGPSPVDDLTDEPGAEAEHPVSAAGARSDGDDLDSDTAPVILPLDPTEAGSKRPSIAAVLATVVAVGAVVTWLAFGRHGAPGTGSGPEASTDPTTTRHEVVATETVAPSEPPEASELEAPARLSVEVAPPADQPDPPLDLDAVEPVTTLSSEASPEAAEARLDEQLDRRERALEQKIRDEYEHEIARLRAKDQTAEERPEPTAGEERTSGVEAPETEVTEAADVRTDESIAYSYYPVTVSQAHTPK